MGPIKWIEGLRSTNLLTQLLSWDRWSPVGIRENTQRSEIARGEGCTFQSLTPTRDLP